MPETAESGAPSSKVRPESLEKRVLPQARRFQTLGAAGSKDVALLDAIEVAPVPLSAAELRVMMPASGEIA